MTSPSRLGLALERGEIEAYFQPQLDLASGRLVAVEALARWRHPERGILTPRLFVPDAETSGDIHALGMFMLIDSCRCGARWAAQGAPIDVSVNVSAEQLRRLEFFDDVLDALDRTSLDAHSLILEITETLSIRDPEIAIRGLERLHRAGVGISIDDFGTGFSSLEQVERLPSTELKLDASLTQSDGPDASERLESIVLTAHGLGLRVVAEGVETQEQYDRAARVGCDRAQGFLIGYPMPESELDAALEVMRP